LGIGIADNGGIAMRLRPTRRVLLILASLQVLALLTGVLRVGTVVVHDRRAAAAQRAEARALAGYARTLAPTIDRALRAAVPLQEVLSVSEPDPFDVYAARDAVRRTPALPTLAAVRAAIGKGHAPKPMLPHQQQLTAALDRMTRALTELRSSREFEDGDALYDRIYGTQRGAFLSALNDIDDAALAVYRLGRLKHPTLAGLKVTSREGWIAAADRSCGHLGEATLMPKNLGYLQAKRALTKLVKAHQTWVTALRRQPVPAPDARTLRGAVLPTLAIVDRLNAALHDLSVHTDFVGEELAYSRFVKLSAQMRAVSRALRGYGAAFCSTVLDVTFDLTRSGSGANGDVSA
jgi:hypothetical protein